MSKETQKPTEQQSETTIVKANPRVTTKVLEQITVLKNRGLALPPDYSAANALNSAWLALQEVLNRDRKPIIANGQLTGVVTELSIVNALHDMVIQGLNPQKKQCYFIVYDTKLICQRSYFGDMVIAQRLKPGIDFYYDTINEGDEFEAEKLRTPRGFVTTVSKHIQKFPRSEKLLGAYCGIIDRDGMDLGADIMEMPRIHKSWSMSKTQGKVHSDFAAEMALRTVIRHRCKPIINSSNDEMLVEAMLRQEADAVEAEIAMEAEVLANAETLELPPTKQDTDSANAEEEAGGSKDLF